MFSFSPLSGSQSSFTVRASIQEVGKFPCAAWGGENFQEKVVFLGGWQTGWLIFFFWGFPILVFFGIFHFDLANTWHFHPSTLNTMPSFSTNNCMLKCVFSLLWTFFGAPGVAVTQHFLNIFLALGNFCK